MAKVIDKGQLPPDHPMFSSGPQVFTPIGVPKADSTPPAAPEPSEESEEGQKLDGARRIARFRHQNAQMLKASGTAGATEAASASPGAAGGEAAPSASAATSRESMLSDKVADVMANYPGLTAEKAREMLEAFGF